MACHAVRARINMLELRNLRLLPSVLGGTSLGDYSVCLHCPPRIPSWNTRFGLGDMMGHIKEECVSLLDIRNLTEYRMYQAWCPQSGLRQRLCV